jgi:hypothetical protein
MEHKDKITAIQFIRPNAIFTLKDDVLTWLDDNQAEPTNAEIQAGWVDYNNWKNTPEGMKALLLSRLGLTQEEFNTLTA